MTPAVKADLIINQKNESIMREPLFFPFFLPFLDFLPKPEADLQLHFERAAHCFFVQAERTDGLKEVGSFIALSGPI